MLDQREEAKFDDLKKKCRELGIPSPPEVFIGMQVRDRNNNIIYDDKSRGHSWNRNFYNYMFAVLTDAIGGNVNDWGAGHMSLKTPAGLNYYSNLNIYNRTYEPLAYGMLDNTNSATHGILVGTGTSVFSAEDYKLQTLIAHGNSALQLFYGAMTYPVQVYAGTTWTNTLTRLFNNNSGGGIIVAEVGIYHRQYVYSVGNIVFCIERTKLGAAVTVPNGAQLTVHYDISMDFAAIDS
jgi:hypothetical protein